MIAEAIKKLAGKENLAYDEAYAVMDEIMSGTCTNVQITAYLAELMMKGETIDEITASAAAMRAHGAKLEHDHDVLEIVGTGGDGAKSFNISTTSSIIIAAGGVKVAKHGNRAASSLSGAADVLESLGVNIRLSPEKAVELLDKVGICFLFAQTYHSAMKYVGPVRKELGIRTIFNILGPLTNPASANMQVMGVFDKSLVEPMARVLHNLGVNKGMIVYGMDKLDEISASAPTAVCEIAGDDFKCYEIKPEDFGMTPCQKSDIVGGTPQENAQITLNILTGKEQGGKLNAVLLNAGAGLYVGGKAATLSEGVALAKELVASGKAYAKLQEFIEESNK